MLENQDVLGKAGFRVDQIGSIYSVEIARAEKKNALTEAMWIELSETFKRLGRREKVRAIVLGGGGGNFCAGADISEFDTARRGQRAAVYEESNSRAFQSIRECPVPTIAAIDGICFGGGFGLAAACDVRIASKNAQFSVPAARLGLAYPVDAMSDIVEALGPQLARYMTFSAGRIDAAAAFRSGFLLETTEAPAINRAMEIAHLIGSNAPLSVRASKAAIRAVLSKDPKDIQAATELGKATFMSGDYEEGRRAFREKRPPQFGGT